MEKESGRSQKWFVGLGRLENESSVFLVAGAVASRGMGIETEWRKVFGKCEYVVSGWVRHAMYEIAVPEEITVVTTFMVFFHKELEGFLRIPKYI